MSAATLLAEVETAISATLVCQSYQAPGGRAKQMAALATLHQMRRDLLAEVSVGSESSGSMASICVMDGAR